MQAFTGGYPYLKEQATAQGNGVLTSKQEEECVIRGCAYDIETTFPIASNETVYVVVDPSAITDKRFTVLPTQWEMTQSHSKITLGVCDSASGGTAYTFLNRNYYFGTTKPATTTCYIGATPTNPIDSQTNFMLGGASAKSFNLGGGSSSGGAIKILDSQYVYYFKVENQEDLSSIVTMFLYIFEPPISPELGY